MKHYERLNIYQYDFSVKCPNGGEPIMYALSIRHPEMIMAEDIVKACDLAGPLFQEQIADHLANELPGDISIVAEHAGVMVITER